MGDSASQDNIVRPRSVKEFCEGINKQPFSYSLIFLGMVVVICTSVLHTWAYLVLRDKVEEIDAMDTTCDINDPNPIIEKDMKFLRDTPSILSVITVVVILFYIILSKITRTKVEAWCIDVITVILICITIGTLLISLNGVTICNRYGESDCNDKKELICEASSSIATFFSIHTILMLLWSVNALVYRSKRYREDH